MEAASINDSIQALLGARLYLYRVFHALTASEPTAENLSLFAGDMTEAALEIFSAPYDQALFQDVRRRLGDDGFLDRLRAEYTRFFIGPEELPAPPWESVYVTGEKVLLQACTLEVRRTYAKHGVLPAEYPRVADDHLALELDFMATLSDRTAEVFSRGETEAAVSLLKDQACFLREHLLRWVPGYVEAFRQAGEPSLLYAPVSVMLYDWLIADIKGIEEIFSVLDRGQ